MNNSCNRTFWKSFQHLFIVISVTGVMMQQSSASNLNCPAYAAAAMAQNNQNQMQQCGFAGARWSNNFQAHVDWCNSAQMADLTREDRARKQLLQTCTNKVANKQKACQNYATSAVNQQRANKAQGCGFSGGAWSEKHAGHFNWCLSANEQNRSAAERDRNSMLQGCKTAQAAGKKQVWENACRAYAKTAVSQNTENIRRKCNFQGGSWSSNEAGHFNWCLGANSSQTAKSINFRIAALKNKCMYKVCTTRKRLLKTTTSCRMVPRPG